MAGALPPAMQLIDLAGALPPAMRLNFSAIHFQTPRQRWRRLGSRRALERPALRAAVLELNPIRRARFLDACAGRRFASAPAAKAPHMHAAACIRRSPTSSQRNGRHAPSVRGGHYKPRIPAWAMLAPAHSLGRQEQLRHTWPACTRIGRTSPPAWSSPLRGDSPCTSCSNGSVRGARKGNDAVPMRGPAVEPSPPPIPPPSGSTPTTTFRPSTKYDGVLEMTGGPP